MYKPIYGLCTESLCAIKAGDLTLKVPDDAFMRITTTLGPGDFTYFMLSDGVSYEFVKVTQQQGQLIMERGQDGTVAREWGACTKVVHEWSPSAMAEAAQQAKDQTDKSYICEIVSDSLDVKDANDDGCDCHETCGVRIEAKPCGEAEWVSGCTRFKLGKDGCVSTEPIGDCPADGVYKNAVVTVSGGRVVDVQEGTNVIKSSCGSCCK